MIKNKLTHEPFHYKKNDLAYIEENMLILMMMIKKYNFGRVKFLNNRRTATIQTFRFTLNIFT